ncbi:hypothetical protein Vqi01_36840 [Micromonospora qiuiae]|uniref:Secreted protein n=1 Tax=Micromonospora qiuiae TaxID=502268 RepID=A0ABQ4JEC8_9ACTN|nr:DUF6493 family protein [Micromonospora qiuiae]GIJ28522.1 hypothetical protein Vqi01_36840 [Micromonospora qiuiae]
MTGVKFFLGTARRQRELAAGGTGDLFDLVSKGHAEVIAAALTGLPEQRRREIGAELTGWFKKRDRETWWDDGTGTALAVLVVGCLPTAAQAAAILARESVGLDGARAAKLVRGVAQERGVDWLVDLAYRMAARFGQETWTDRWQFVATLLHAEGAAPPTDDRSVQLWLSAVEFPDRRHRGRPVPVADRLRADPFLPMMLPRLFEVDGIGTQMMFAVEAENGNWDDRERNALLTALVQLAAESSIDRAMLIDGAIGRLLRGDRPTALRAFTTLLGLLQPTAAEITARRTDYLRLLTDAPAPVATMAQKALRELPDLAVESIIDASGQVLTRPEKALVRTQLTWLDRLARQQPDRAAEIAEVITVAAKHPAVELRDRAIALAARHGLDPDALGPAVAEPRGDDLPASPPPAPAPEPIANVDELAEEVAALFGNPAAGTGLDRILDGLVRLTARDGAAVADTLGPILERRHWSWGDGDDDDPLCLCGLVVGVFQTATERHPRRLGRWEALLAALRRFDPARPESEPVRSDFRVPGPHRVLRARLAEIGLRLGEPGMPGLLAAPTSANGSLDPFVLVDRLAALGDHTPWPWDLNQALLRLPTGSDEAAAGKAAALGTPAGERLAAWLRDGGLPQPVMRASTIERRPRHSGYDWEYDHLPAKRVLIELRPPDGHQDRYGLLSADPAPLDVDHHYCSHLWPSVLPHHRGVVAAYLLPMVAATADMDSPDGTAVLPLLAETAGPGGIALDLAVAYGLGARHVADRVAALDALLALAAAGQLDPRGLGEQLGTLVAGRMVKATRVVEPLRDAAQAGAPLTVWRLLAAALPAILAAATAPRGLPDLLTLAAETATATGVRIDLPGLAEVAARGGSSRLATEARRLHRAGRRAACADL